MFITYKIVLILGKGGWQDHQDLVLRPDNERVQGQDSKENSGRCDKDRKEIIRGPTQENILGHS